MRSVLVTKFVRHAGAIKDDVIGLHNIMKALIMTLSSDTHFTTLESIIQHLTASLSSSHHDGPISRHGPSHSAGQAASSRQGDRPYHHQRQAWQTSGPGTTNPKGLLKICLALQEASLASLETEQWHPGLEDEGLGEAEQRLEMFLDKMGVAGGLDPSRATAVMTRAVKAFRNGELGRYTLDDIRRQ